MATPSQHISFAPIQYIRTVLVYIDQRLEDNIEYTWKGKQHQIILNEKEKRISFRDESDTELYYCSYDYPESFVLEDVVVRNSFPTE